MSARSEAKQLNHALPVSPIDSTTGSSSEDVVIEMLKRSEKEMSNRNQISKSAFNQSKSIQDFFQKINSTGLYSPSRYDVSFDKQIISREAQDMLTFQCIDISFPGKNFRTADVRTYGPVRRPVIDAEFNGELTMTFRVSRDFAETKYIDEWMDFISSPRTRYDVQYYDDYVCNLYIDALDKGIDVDAVPGVSTYKSSNVLYRCEVREVYPKSMDSIPLGFAKANEIATFSVTFAYRDWIIIPIPVGNNDDLQNQAILRQFDRRQVGREQPNEADIGREVGPLRGVDFQIPGGDFGLA